MRDMIGDEPSRKERHNAFDGKRERAFLDALGTRGCVREAARRTGVSPQTVYNHQRTDKAFARQCALALEKAATDLELEAWERAVKGEEVPIVYRGEVVGTRLKRSDGMLQFLLRAAKPKKYGRHAGFTRKRLVAAERKNIERQVRMEFAAKRPSLEDLSESILRKFSAIEEHEAPAKIAAGWTRLDGGGWIPPGWVRADGADDLEEFEDGEEVEEAADPGAALRWPENRVDHARAETWNDPV